ncbi:MAG: 2-C-methyl-D-erythritol 2,4-cyclodiphosphate synthase [Caldisericia bacterium]|nr:2-C-methyl-D-erythritol 2,4-cyclodiphosphate synthase [Caldisericia bacterium]
MNRHKASCVIVGGGSGSRFSTTQSKLHVSIAGKPVYIASIQNFIHDDRIEEIILVGSFCENDLEKWFPSHRKVLVVEGGETRTKSVWNGLQKCSPNTEWVFIHDAARPFVPSSVLDALFRASQEECIEGAVPTLPLYDSLKKTEGKKRILETVCKENVLRAQTPQLFRKKTLMEAYQMNQTPCEDETQLLLRCFPSAIIQSVPGSFFSEKITDPPTRSLLEKLSVTSPRVGIGWDFHPFEKGRTLVLGGVTVPHHIGLEGDSDGDVISHAVIDAILGALGMGDIGSYFGVKTPLLMGIQSMLLLHNLRSAQFSFLWDVGNIDITVVCKTPPIHSLASEMKRNFARALHVSENRFNIKATTDKGMDSAGQGKGIRAVAIATILQQEGFHE